MFVLPIKGITLFIAILVNFSMWSHLFDVSKDRQVASRSLMSYSEKSYVQSRILRERPFGSRNPHCDIAAS